MKIFKKSIKLKKIIFANFDNFKALFSVETFKQLLPGIGEKMQIKLDG